MGVANYMFELIAARDDCLLAGVYPMANRDWMKPTVSEANAYVVGALYFCINDVRLREPEHDELEDWWRELSEQAAGRPVLRVNWIGIQTQYWKNAGGMQQDRSEAHRDAMVDRLACEFHTLVKRRVRRNGTTDLKFLAAPVLWGAAPAPVHHETSPAHTTDEAALDVSSGQLDPSDLAQE